MRLCLDCIPLLIRSSGVKTYIYELESHLRKLLPDGHLNAFPFLNGSSALEHDVSMLGPRSTFARLVLVNLLNKRVVPSIELLTGRVDVFHASNQIWRPPRRPRLTTTVQDMTTWLLPEVHTPANIAHDKAFGMNIVGRAEGVIVPSESTRRDAIEILGLKPERVHVIYHGVSGAYFDHPSLSAATAAKYNLTRPYILFVSTIEPRKNLDRLLDAYSGLSAGIRDEFELIVAGPEGWASTQTIQRLASGEPGVRYLGYVPEVHLPGLTAGASLFVYPSLYEGFGFPVAQAMAAGVPVLTSAVSSLPEVVGDTARLVDPRSVDEIRKALEDLLLSPSVRREMAVRGRERARMFQWGECAEKSLRFFQTVCGKL